jgi:hypothetical protein
MKNELQTQAQNGSFLLDLLHKILPIILGVKNIESSQS